MVSRKMEAVQILQMLITSKRDRLLHLKRASCNKTSEGVYEGMCRARGWTASQRAAARLGLPSSQRKSGRATSCSGISFRNPGRWQRGLPVTIFRLRSQSPSQARRQSQLKEFAKRLLCWRNSVRKAANTHTQSVKHACGDGVRVSQGGEGLESVEGSWSDGGQLVVIQRQQADVVQPCETVVMNAADLVVSQHPKEKRHTTLQFKAQLRVVSRWLPGPYGCHSHHTQSLQPTEHPTSNRVDLIGCEVKLNDGRCAFKCPIFNLCDLVVAKVTVQGESLG